MPLGLGDGSTIMAFLLTLLGPLSSHWNTPSSSVSLNTVYWFFVSISRLSRQILPVASLDFLSSS